LFIVVLMFTTLLYFFIFRLNIRSKSQYIWLAASSGFYIYTALQLRKIPEEAVHLLEFGVLSYCLFRALSHRIRDWTVYVTTSLFVFLIGMIDEFIQWVIPGRIWDYRDVGINGLAGVFFVLMVGMGIKPHIARGPVNKGSVNILAGIIIINLIFLGLCLSNTPDAVKSYTSVFPGLSWLVQEEPMSEYGHNIRAFFRKSHYPVEAWKLISLFSVRTAWYIIIASIVTVVAGSKFWKRRLTDG
ncbi:MAG: VanZ family protein, partial [Nitrospirota bacterium]